MAAPTVLSEGCREGEYESELKAKLPDNEVVEILLLDLQSRESVPERKIHLRAPEYEISIGRGSQTEPHLYPKRTNAWFTSRVMSREHATLKVNPKTKQIYLEDTGSMHGTYVEGKRLQQNQPVQVGENEKIQFGSEIVRGDRKTVSLPLINAYNDSQYAETYKPLEVSLFVNWNEDVARHNVEVDCTTMALSSSSRSPLQNRSDHTAVSNTFSVDYSEEDHYADEDDDIEVVYQTTIPRSLEAGRSSRTFSVPDSDISDTSDIGKHLDTSPSSLAESPELALKPLNRSILGNMTVTPTGIAQKLCTAIPGSTSLNALNVSDDEEDVRNEGEKLEEDEDDAMSNESNEHGGYSDDDNDTDDSDDDDDDDDVGSQISDVNDMSDVEEEQTFGDTGSVKPDTGRCHAAIEAVLRDPSPSDAAMAKASWYPHNLPNIHDVVDPAPMMFGNTCSNGPYPSTLPFMSPLCPYPGVGWGNDINNHSYPGHYDQGFVSPLLIQSSVSQEGRKDPVISNDSAERLPVQPVVTSPPAYPAAKCESPTKPSKVSINAIIDEIQPDTVPTNNNRKRKIEEISNVTAAEQSARIVRQRGQSPPSTKHVDSTEDVSLGIGTTNDGISSTMLTDDLTDVHPERHSPVRKTVSFSPKTIVIDDAELDRPLKKARMQQEHQSSNTLKYVAAAVAGMTLGAVGTIFGLAALPADYFL